MPDKFSVCKMDGRENIAVWLGLQGRKNAALNLARCSTRGGVLRLHHNLDTNNGGNMERIMQAQTLRNSSVTTCVVACLESSRPNGCSHAEHLIFSCVSACPACHLGKNARLRDSETDIECDGPKRGVKVPGNCHGGSSAGRILKDIRRRAEMLETRSALSVVFTMSVNNGGAVSASRSALLAADWVPLG